MTSNSPEEFVADERGLEDEAEGAAAQPLPYLTQTPDDQAAALQKQHDVWRAELARLEYEINTLRTVLVAKNTEAAALKKKLGITPMVEIKQDLQYGIQTIKDSGAYQKTNAALKSFGDFASRKLGDLRNSNAFKSVEEKVGVAYSSVKRHATSSRSDGNVKDAAMETETSPPPGDASSSVQPENSQS